MSSASESTTPRPGRRLPGAAGRSGIGPVLVLLMLAGCAERPTQQILVPVVATRAPGTASPEAAGQVRMFVATTRARAAGDPSQFTDARSTDVNFVSYDISIPASHRAAEVEWPGSPPDPAKQFTTTARQDYDRAGFLRALTPRRADVSLYVHGYNNRFSEAVFQAAQISHDSRSGMVPVLFAWPSVSSLTGYVADRDAADFSRGHLARLIEDLAQSPRVRRLFVIGHSMGGRLTMEALMQIRLSGKSNVLDRLEVVLADPDIDQDLFWEQVRTVGPMKTPLAVMVASDDRALQMSQFLAFGRERIGKIDIRTPELARRAEALNLRVIDVSSLDTDAIAHNRIEQIAVLYNSLPAATEQANLRESGAFVLGAIGQGIARLGEGVTPR